MGSNQQVMLLTSNYASGFKVDRVIGLTYGITVRSRGIGGNLVAGLRTIGGGEIKEYTELTYLLRRCPELGVDTLIDVGANIGVYSCILLRNNAVPRAILFEPGNLSAEVALLASSLANGGVRGSDLVCDRRESRPPVG